MANRSAGDAARLRARALLESGRAYFARKDYRAALERFEEAVKSDAGYGRAQAARALAFIKLGRAAEALAACDELISKDPAFALGHSTRGAALQYLGRAEEARAAYERALGLEPDNPFVNYNVACFWARAGDAARAREYLTRAIELDPKMNIVAAVDEDFQTLQGEPWFQELVAFRRRAE